MTGDLMKVNVLATHTIANVSDALQIGSALSHPAIVILYSVFIVFSCPDGES